jgi:ABC-2 type transport system permease protein
MSLIKWVARIFAFMGKEVIETMRRPGAIVSLVVGPFLILLAFGFSFNGVRRPLDAVVVVPPSSGLPTDVASYAQYQTPGLNVDHVVPDEADGRRLLDSGQDDLVILPPPDLQQRFQSGRQSTIGVEYAVLDPIRASNANLLAAQISAEVNKQLITQAAQQGETAAAAAGQPNADRIPPEVIAQPTRAQAINLSPTQPDLVGFFGPAAIALVLQHIAVTLMALALVRERARRRPEVFRISPTGTSEIVLGKLAAFLLLGMLVGTILIGTMIGVFAVPVLAPIGLVAIVAVLLLLASLAVGSAIAAISDSERQAVQLSLLMLLTSVFFSGFVLSIDEFHVLGQAIAYVLPVTHGVRLLQDLMLLGRAQASDAAALVAIAVVLFVPSLLLLRRSLVEA